MKASKVLPGMEKAARSPRTTVEFSDDMYSRIQKICENYKMSMSTLVRLALDEYMVRMEKQMKSRK